MSPPRTGSLLAASLLSLCLTAASGAQTQTARPPLVAATIKPIHSLLAAVMEGVGRPRLLIEGSQSPHHHQMRPSDVRLLSRALLVFWIGGTLETSFKSPLSRLAAEGRLVTLSQAPGIARLTDGLEDEGGLSHDQNHGHDGDHEAETEAFDPHLWLDPRNAAAMAQAMVRALAAADPANAAAYRANGLRVQRRLDDLTEETHRLLAKLPTRSLMLTHNFLLYFAHRFRLRVEGYVSEHEELAPSALRIRQLHRQLRRRPASCVLEPPPAGSPLLRALVAGTKALTGVFDPLGWELEPGPELYFDLMRQNAQRLHSCLEGPR